MAKKREEDFFVECHHPNGTVIMVPNRIFTKVVMAQRYEEQFGIIPKAISYKQGAVLYSVSEKFFREWAQQVNAVKHVKGRALVIVEKLDRALDYC